jgi:D-glycero-D-manno-heptose 1,7-bisphosphate phosphatase
MIHPKPLLKRAVFLDRDGTLNRDEGYVYKVEHLELLPNVVAGLRQLASLGYELIIATNQSGIARGYFTEAEMHAFNRALCDRLEREGVRIAAVYYCPFHPTAGIGPYRRESTFRKPQSGMLLMASAERGINLRASFAIGDKASDIAAGRGADCRTILLSGQLSQAELKQAAPDYVAHDLLDAARYIERTNRKRSPAEEALNPAMVYGRAG